MALYSNYSNFNNYNNQNYMRELQSMRDQIDRQMAQAQQTQQQIQQMQAAPQQPQITQTFQLGNTQQNMNDFDARYSENVEDVKNTLVFKPSIFVTKDMSTLWLKEIAGKDSYVGQTQYDTGKVYIEGTTEDEMLITLKHELMHIWLYEHGHKNQDNQEMFSYEELCEYVAYSNDFINRITNKYLRAKYDC